MKNGAPSLRSMNRFAVNVPGGKEAIYQPLYDYQTYLAAGQTSLNFFQIPVGQSGKTIADTNMDLAGSLPQGKEFLLQAIEIAFFPGTPVAVNSAPAAPKFVQDLYAFMKSGHLQLFIGSKPYLDEAPLGVFGQGFGLEYSAALSDSTTAGASGFTAAEYGQLSRQIYNITPVKLTSQQNFKVTMDWPTAVALPSTANARVGVRLRGVLYRNAQ